MAPPSGGTTYEVGTTALTPDRWNDRDRYRERRSNDEWATRSGEKTGMYDRTAQTYYTDITPPGAPLAAGTILDKSKRYVYDGGNGIRILDHRGSWKIDTGTVLEGGQFRVSEYEVIREIREPGYVGVQNAWVTLDETNVWRDAMPEVFEPVQPVQYWVDECAELSEKLSHANVEIDGLRDDLAAARSERDAAFAGEAAALLQRDKARGKLAHDVFVLDYVPAEDLHKAESQLASTRAGNAKLLQDLTEARQELDKLRHNVRNALDG
jgi:hypothetical protein